MSFGFSVGDFVAVGEIAWKLYKACKGAPESFGHIHVEVLSFHAVLKEIEETVVRQPQSDERQARLATVGNGCTRVLDDLQQLVDKYESQPTKAKQTWNRMRWGFENVSDIRGRLVSSTVMLTAFISTSQLRVEAKLEEFLMEVRKGHREASVISMQTVDSLSTGDKELWRSIRKELEDMGLSLAAFDANKDFISSWLMNAIADRAFEEQAGHVEEVDSGSRSGFSGSASTTRPELPNQEAFEALRLETTSSSSPADSVRSVLKVKISPRSPDMILSQPIHSSESSFQRGGKAGKRDTQAKTVVEQIYASATSDPQHSSSRTSQMGQANSSASPTLVDNMLEPSHSSSKGLLKHDQDLSSRWKAHSMWQPLRSHMQELLSLGTWKGPGRALMNVIKEGHTTEALKLLQSQSSPGSSAIEQVAICRALTLAVQEGIPELLEPLLAAGQVGINDHDLLTVAVETKKIGKEGIVTLQRLLSLGADPSLFGGSCIQRAIELHDPYPLRALLNAGVDVNARIGVNRSTTPLHRALSIGASKTKVRMILDSGAEINQVDLAEQTPLGIAIAEKRYDYVDVLIRHGADLEKPIRLYSIKRRVSPLIGAAVMDESRMVKLLVDKGADINKHHASLSVLDLLPPFDLFPRYPSLQDKYARLFRLLGRCPACAVHAAVVHDLSAKNTLKVLLEEGASTNWDFALIFAFIHCRRRQLRGSGYDEGAFVLVLKKCSETRGSYKPFCFVESYVFHVMAACIVRIDRQEMWNDESYLRLLVDDVIPRCN